METTQVLSAAPDKCLLLLHKSTAVFVNACAVKKNVTGSDRQTYHILHAIVGVWPTKLMLRHPNHTRIPEAYVHAQHHATLYRLVLSDVASTF